MPHPAIARCTRCGLQVFRSNFDGAIVSYATSTTSCAGWDLPEDERPVYPYHGSLHELEASA